MRIAVVNLRTARVIDVRDRPPAAAPGFLALDVTDRPEVGLGWILPAGAASAAELVSPMPPAAERSLEDAKITRVGELEVRFRGILAAGVAFGGAAYQIDEVSQGKLTAMGALADRYRQAAGGYDDDGWDAFWAPLGGFRFIAADNIARPLSASGMAALSGAATLTVAALYYVRRAHKDAIAALTTIADVDAYDIAAGWPG